MVNQMKVLAKRVAKKTYPTGNPNFAVMQAFPAGFNEFEADPFLMCDFYSFKSTKIASGPDDFPINWHPHRGMDICTYQKSGLGRHGDSLGNRETFKTPGMQWISVGSGIEHAEGGGTPIGELEEGFQLWFNTPGARKMDDPRYGTNDESTIPTIKAEGVLGRILAGTVGDLKGPFETIQEIQMVDFELQPSASTVHTIPASMNNCLAFIYSGNGIIAETAVKQYDVLRFDCSNPLARDIELISGDGLKVIFFAGKKIDEPIEWHGPFVMNNSDQIRQTLLDYRSGKFPPKRVPWDYKNSDEFPKK